MTFPKRWLEDDDAAGAVRDVLRAGREVDPPEGAEKAVWLALVAQIGVAGAGGAAGGAAGSSAAGGGAAGGSATAAGATSAKIAAGAGTTASAAGGAASGGVLKAILIGAFSGVVAVSGYSVIEPAPPPPAPVAPAEAEPAPAPQKVATPIQTAPASSVSPSPVPSSAPLPTEGARDPSSPVVAPSAPTEPEPSVAAPAGTSDVGAGAPSPGSAEERESRLREENELLRQARGALRGGDPGRAMLLLEQSRQKFPGGVLGQEREALTIEALARGGAREAASSRAAAFIKAHPTSPHAARLQAFVLP